MQQSHHFLILLLPLLFLPFIASESPLGSMVRVWTPRKDIKDPHVIEIAKFAVDEYNKHARSSLKLVMVVSGEIVQVDLRTTYLLFLQATGRAGKRMYRAVVWEKAWRSSKHLISFEPLED
ncbi:hypothetical protein HRI_002995700 [Hibiscus trionum]|uniref:Cystatin domain-containing protein n=1 Tax=Hibiscus trionum TaxID=183268 RepID=A0A9W7IC20_HIBTR|nr:hypothetical protein HRI_002995700 [Hibiscus trionum]